MINASFSRRFGDACLSLGGSKMWGERTPPNRQPSFKLPRASNRLPSIRRPLRPTW